MTHPDAPKGQADRDALPDEQIRDLHAKFAGASVLMGRRSFAALEPDSVVPFARALLALTHAAASRVPEEPAGPLPPLLNGGQRRVPCMVEFDPTRPQFGWLFIPHADGKWVSLCKLPAFSKSVIEYWLNEPNSGG